MSHFLLLSIQLFANIAMAAPIYDKDFSASIAEYVHFSAKGTDNFSDWVSALKIPSERQLEIQAYLKESGLSTKPVPQTQWKEKSPVLIILGSGKPVKLDFSMSPRNGSITLNGIVIPKNRNFSDTVNAIQKALQPSRESSLFDLMLPKAQAGIFDATIYRTDIFAAIAEAVSGNQQDACAGKEKSTHDLCVTRSDSEMILSDLGFDNAKYKNTLLIKKFQCEGSRFKELVFSNYNESSGERIKNVNQGDQRIVFTYDKITFDDQRKLTAITTYNKFGKMCEFSMYGEKVYKTQVGQTDAGFNCQAITTTSAHNFDKLGPDSGDLRFVAGIDVPIQRLNSCCKFKDCQADMAKHVKEFKSELIVKPHDMYTNPGAH